MKTVFIMPKEYLISNHAPKNDYINQSNAQFNQNLEIVTLFHSAV